MPTQLTVPPANGEPETYVTIHRGIGGWNSSVWKWQPPTEGGPGYYDCLQTGFTNTSIGSGSREDAVREATGWARDEELPLWIPEPREVE